MVTDEAYARGWVWLIVEGRLCKVSVEFYERFPPPLQRGERDAGAP
jgi:hypothetical protein